MIRKTKGPVPQPEQSAQSLIDGVMADAAEKARALEKQAESYASSKLRAAEARAAALRREAAAAAEAKAAGMLEAAKSKLRTERRRLELEAEERFAAQVLALAEGICLEMAGKPEYEERILAWICEAAVGIGSEEAVVHFSDAEQPYVTPNLLARAEEMAQELVGKKPRLLPAEGPLLRQRGILLESEDGRVAYDNRIKTRLSRSEKAARNIVAAALESAKAGLGTQEAANP